MSFSWFTALGTAHTVVWVGASGAAALCFAFACGSTGYLFVSAGVGFIEEAFWDYCFIARYLFSHELYVFMFSVGSFYACWRVWLGALSVSSEGVGGF